MIITKQLMFAMCAHVFWVALLYVLLTVLRAPKVWGVDSASGAIARYVSFEPRVSANLSNQFEWSVFFYAACIIAIINQSAHHGLVWLAWLFVLGRMCHTAVQVFTTNIRLRGLVFTINFLAVLAMWAVLILTYV